MPCTWCLEYILRKLAEMKFGVLVGIVVWFGGTIVATGVVFCAGYVTIFFILMDMTRLVAKWRWRRRDADGGTQAGEIELELETVDCPVDAEVDGEDDLESNRAQEGPSESNIR